MRFYESWHFIECEVYTEEQLRPKAQRLDSAYIDEIAKKYADLAESDDAEMRESDNESASDGAENLHSFASQVT